MCLNWQQNPQAICRRLTAKVERKKTRSIQICNLLFCFYISLIGWFFFERFCSLSICIFIFFSKKMKKGSWSVSRRMMVDISFRHRGMDFFFLSMILVFFSFCSIQANIFFNSHSFLELLLYVAVFKYLRITSPHGNHLALFPGVWVCAHI